MFMFLFQAAQQAKQVAPNVYVTVQQPSGLPEWVKILITAAVGALVGVMSNAMSEILKPGLTRHGMRRLMSRQLTGELKENLRRLKRFGQPTLIGFDEIKIPVDLPSSPPVSKVRYVPESVEKLQYLRHKSVPKYQPIEDKFAAKEVLLVERRHFDHYLKHESLLVFDIDAGYNLRHFYQLLEDMNSSIKDGDAIEDILKYVEWADSSGNEFLETMKPFPIRLAKRVRRKYREVFKGEYEL